MLAQIQNVDPSFLKNFILVLGGVITGAGGLATVYGMVRKRRIEPQPLEVKAAESFVNKQFCEALHTETVRRMALHDEQIKELWNTMRTEDTKTREMMAHAIRDFDQSINRVIGSLDEVKENQRSILARVWK